MNMIVTLTLSAQYRTYFRTTGFTSHLNLRYQIINFDNAAVYMSEIKSLLSILIKIV
jgi:hypothetical protein